MAGGHGGTGERKSCHPDEIFSAVGEVPRAVPQGAGFLDHSSGPSHFF